MTKTEIVIKFILEGKLDEELGIKNGDSLQRYNVVQELFHSKRVDSSNIVEKYYTPVEPLRIQPGQIPPNTPWSAPYVYTAPSIMNTGEVSGWMGVIPPKTEIERIYFQNGDELDGKHSIT